MYIDSENKDIVVKTFKKRWEEFRQALGQNIIDYNELEKAKEYDFLKVLEGVLRYEGNSIDLQEKFITLATHYSFCRATKKGEDELIENMNYERFLPKEEFIEEDNRFSPKGVEYLYMACKTKMGREINYSCIEEVALKEVRAEQNNIYGICKFKIESDIAISQRKVINLTIADNKTFEKIEQDFCNSSDDYTISNFTEFLTKKGNVDMKKLEKYTKESTRKFCLDIYFKILSSELFKPVENAKDKEFEYAPFHCLAYYFKQLGYDGIIYKSTVSDSMYGKNIVLFDKFLAKPYDKIRFVDSTNKDVKID